MRKILFLLTLSIMLFVTSCIGLAHTAEHEAQIFRIKIFACEIPVPTSYVLNGREFDRIVLSRDSGDVGRIVVSNFSGYSDMYDPPEEKTIGHLIVAELLNHREWKTADYDMSIIRDDEHIVALMGAARALKAGMVEACIESKNVDAKSW